MIRCRRQRYIACTTQIRVVRYTRTRYILHQTQRQAKLDKSMVDDTAALQAAYDALAEGLPLYRAGLKDDVREALVWTVPFVVFGLGRYLFLVQTQRGGGSTPS